MTGWVAAFDQSRDRVPISQMEAAYTAGYRVIGFYAGGGSSAKWGTRAEIDAWLTRPGTGVAGLFEIYGTEPIDSPSSGASHAKSARSAWRALGYPDHASIYVAVDENVTLAEARAELTTYFRAWSSADTCKPVAYVEADAGAILFAEGVTAGTFTPAAYAWNDPPVLYAPDNAPSHVLWTQEHNGRGLYGGDLDIGHIRTTAPIWWRSGAVGDTGVSTMDEQSIAAAVLAAKLHNDVTDTDVSLGTFIRSLNTQVNKLATVLVPAVQSAEADQTAAVAKLAAAVADLPGAGPGGTITIPEAVAAFTDVIEREQITVSVAPAPTA